MSALRSKDKQGPFYQHASGRRFYYRAKDAVGRTAAKQAAAGVISSYHVARSTIPNAGNGLFADKLYRSGDTIVEYTGDILNEAQYKHRYPKADARYVVKVSKDRYVDARDKGSDARFINTNPSHNNARFSISSATGRVLVKATKAIHPGKEIYVSYGPSFRLPR